MSDTPPPVFDEEPSCQVCGCTESDYSQCIALTGEPCSWAAPALCSSCVKLAEAATMAMSHTLSYTVGATKEPPPSLEGLGLDVLLAARGILLHYASILAPRADGTVVAPVEIPEHMIAAIFALNAFSGMPANRDKVIVCKNADIMLMVVRNPDKKRVWMPGDPV